MAQPNPASTNRAPSQDPVTDDVGRATKALNVALDQRSVSRAKQDMARPGDTRVDPAMPQWPNADYPPPPMDRPRGSRNDPMDAPATANDGRRGTAQRRVQFKEDHETSGEDRHIIRDDDHVEEESLTQRVNRCLRGISYDLKHWHSVTPDRGDCRIRYILTRDDRTPISIGVVVIFATILVTIALLCRSRRSSNGMREHMYDQMATMTPEQQKSMLRMMLINNQ